MSPKTCRWCVRRLGSCAADKGLRGEGGSRGCAVASVFEERRQESRCVGPHRLGRPVGRGVHGEGRSRGRSPRAELSGDLPRAGGPGPRRPAARSRRAPGHRRRGDGRDSRAPEGSGTRGAGHPAHAARCRRDGDRRVRRAGHGRDSRGHGGRQPRVPRGHSPERRRRRHGRSGARPALAHRSHRDLSRQRASRGRSPRPRGRHVLRAAAAGGEHGRRRLLRRLVGHGQGVGIREHANRGR